jgi:hypothetical protein
MGGVRYWHLPAEASKAERFRLCPNFRQPFARSMSRSLAFAEERTDKRGYLLVATPGSGKPLEKTSFYTKVGDQICGVGYYKG